MPLSRTLLKCCVFGAVAAAVAGPPAVLIADTVSAPPSAAGQWRQYADNVNAGISIPPPAAGSVDGTAQPVRLVVPYLVVVAPRGLSAAQVARIRTLPGVRGALAVDGGQIDVNGHQASVIGVSASFRSWTPPDTASADGIWSALSTGSIVATYDAANRLGLTLGGSYLVGGAVTSSVPFTAIAPSGVPGADAMVDSQVSASLGLTRNVAVLISAPGAAYGTLVQRLLAVTGAQGRVLDLVPVQQQPAAPSLPVVAATQGLPGNWTQLYQDAAARYCPGLSWTVLAAIGQIESGDGANDGPSSAGALGPMQFMPSTGRSGASPASAVPGRRTS